MLNNSVSDETLWKAIVLDDSQAFIQLYNRHWRKLYRTANYYLNNSSAAEQILQDVFVMLWERRKSLQIRNFDNYLFITARYQVFKYLKAQKISPVVYLESFAEENASYVKNIAEEKLDYQDLEKQLNEYLSALPKRCSEIFRMSRIEQLSNDEIAKQLGISKRTVENQITHATKHLQLSFQDLSGVVILLVLNALLK